MLELEEMFTVPEWGVCPHCGLGSAPGHKCPMPYHPAVARMMVSLMENAPTWRPSEREAARIRLGLERR